LVSLFVPLLCQYCSVEDNKDLKQSNVETVPVMVDVETKLMKNCN